MKSAKVPLAMGLLWVGFGGSAARGQWVDWPVEKVGLPGSSWMDWGSWSDGQVPSEWNSYRVPGGQVLGVPTGVFGPVEDFTGGALLLEQGSTLRVNLGGNYAARVGLAHAPYIEFHQATLQFQKGLGVFTPAEVDAELLMFGANRIVVSGSGPPMPLHFLRKVSSPGGSLSIGPAQQPILGQVFNFMAEVEVEELTIGPVNPFGSGNRVFFSDLESSRLEVRNGWWAIANGRFAVPEVKLTDGTTVLTLNGTIRELQRLQLGGGLLHFGTSSEVAPVVKELSGTVGSQIRNLGGERTLTVHADTPGVFGGRFVDATPGGLSLVKEGASTLTLTADSVLPGRLAVAAGRLQFGSAESAGGIDWGRLELGGELEFASAEVREYGGEVDGSGKLIQSGPGVTRLSGDASGFDGSVEVRDGRLELNGAMGGATVQVHNGLLGGTGSLGGVVVAADGTVTPGNSIGTLTMNSLVLAGMLEMEWSAATPMVDLLRVTGLLQLNDATLRFESLEGTGVLTGAMHVIAEYGSLEGTFSQVENLPVGYRLDYGNGGNRVALVAVPEPGVPMVLGIGAAVFLGGRRRRGNWATAANQDESVAPTRF